MSNANCEKAMEAKISGSLKNNATSVSCVRNVSCGIDVSCVTGVAPACLITKYWRTSVSTWLRILRSDFSGLLLADPPAASVQPLKDLKQASKDWRSARSFWNC